MRKFTRFYLLTLPLFLGVTVLHGQQSDDSHRNLLMAADSFLVNFNRYGQFREIGQSQVSLEVIDRYIELFKPGIYIYDNYNIERDPFDPNVIVKPYKGAYRTIEQFGEQTKKWCDKGVTSKITALNADYSRSKEGQFRFVIQRETGITTFDGKFLNSTEVFELQVRLDESIGRLRVFEFKDIAHTLKCGNCDPSFAKREDPADDPKSKMKIWAQFQAGYGMGTLDFADVSTNDFDRTVYDQLQADRSSISGRTSDAVRNALLVSLESEVMFGHKNQIGGNIGVQWSSFQSGLSTESVILSYRSFDFGNNEYNRVVRLSEFEEDIRFDNLSVQVLGRYTRRVSEKLKIHLGAGPVLGFWGTTTTNSSGVADFEGIYQWQITGLDTISSFEGGNPQFVDEMTEARFAETYGAGADQEWLRRALSGYDLAINRSVQGETSRDQSMNIGWMVRGGAGWMINSSTELTGQIAVVSSRITTSSEALRLVDRTQDSLGQSWSSEGGLNYMNYFLSVGVRMFIASGMKTKE